MVNANLAPGPATAEHDTVLIVTDDGEQAKPIAAALERKHYAVRISHYDGQKLSAIPARAPRAILCSFTELPSQTERILMALRDKYAPHDIPVIGASQSGSEQRDPENFGFDTFLRAGAHPAQIAGRIESMIRLARMQAEIFLRTQTLREDFGIEYALSDMDFDDPIRVLFIGKATPDFMVILNALQSRQVEVVAAFTSFSAFDYLHENTFDAVVMNSQTEPETALAISETMRRNSNLFHVPALLLANEDLPDPASLYDRGVSDIIAIASSEDDISRRILELANFHRMHRTLKSEFEKVGGDDCLDPLSAAYNRDFFLAHLDRVCEYYPSQSYPVALITVTLQPNLPQDLKPEHWSSACDAAGHILKKIVRMQDLVGRLSQDSYAIVFPAETRQDIENVIPRIFNVLDATGFATGLDQPRTFQFEVTVNLTQLLPGEGADSLLERTLGTQQQASAQDPAPETDLYIAELVPDAQPEPETESETEPEPETEPKPAAQSKPSEPEPPEQIFLRGFEPPRNYPKQGSSDQA